MKKKHAAAVLHSASTVADLVATDVLDTLTHAELVVLLRLLVARTRLGVHRLSVLNRELHDEPRTVGRALGGLEKKGVVKVRWDASGSRRTIEVRR